MLTNKQYLKRKQWFEDNEQLLIQAFESAIFKALTDIGDDIKCISWFSSNWEQNIANRRI